MTLEEWYWVAGIVVAILALYRVLKTNKKDKSVNKQSSFTFGSGNSTDQKINDD